MSKLESELRLQAYLDRELPAGEAAQVEAQLASRPDFARLLEELKGVDTALARAGDDLPLPESREFHWSKIKSAIRRAEGVAAARAEETPASSWVWSSLIEWRRWLMPAGAVAGLALVLLLAVYSPSSAGFHHESSFADTGAFTYRDFARGTTLVWLSYPAEAEKEFE